MKKLVLLLMLFGALRSFGAVATNVQNLSAFGTTNRMIAGDGIGISVRYATAQERLLGIRASNLVYSLNLLGIGTNTVFISAGTNIIVVTNRTASNVTYTISVATNDLGGASSMTNALLHAGPTNGSVGALILTAGDNIILSTSGTNRVITTSNNVSLVDVTNIVNSATNGLGVSPPLSSVQYNSNGVQSGSSAFVFTNLMVGIGTNAPQYPLHIFATDISKPATEWSYDTGAGNTVAWQIRNGTGATNMQAEVGGLLRSATIHNSGAITGATATVNALAVTGGTLGAGKVLTDVSGTGAATWQSGGTILSGTTNFVNLSVQAAKLPVTNYAQIEAGWQDWELTYYRTNAEAGVDALSATWDFLVPIDYATNTLKLLMHVIILATNGPATSNTIWGASILRGTPGDATDIHTAAFGAIVTGTNDWAASNTGTNKVQSLVIDFSTNSLVRAGDWATLKLSSDTNSTFAFGRSVTRMQLLYNRQ